MKDLLASLDPPVVRHLKWTSANLIAEDVAAFRNEGHPAVEFGWEEDEYSDPMSACNVLRHAMRKYADFPYTILRRGGRVYVVLDPKTVTSSARH